MDQPAPVTLQSIAAEGTPAIVIFIETDCPTCRLAAPYLNRLTDAARVIGISQDNATLTTQFIAATGAQYTIHPDPGLALSRAIDFLTVPTILLLGPNGAVERTLAGFDKTELNALAAALNHPPICDPYDGAPPFKPGCTSRHREVVTAEPEAPSIDIYAARAPSASRIQLPDDEDPIDYAMRAFGDPLPVVPPTTPRVERMLLAIDNPPDEVIALVPPCYGAATVEKIAANAVMAGCFPELMPVLIPLIRAACDERFNLHGVQATTHFAAPLVILNGPIPRELGFVSGGNVFSNVARPNSTLGRAFQLILTNIGGARPGEIDMSTLGNPGKFSWVIAENEEHNPWTPLHADRGFTPEQSALTLFAGDGLHGVSEHNARTGATVLKAICAVLATVWSWRVCLSPEAFVVLCPEHVDTLHRDGFTKEQIRQFLFDHTGIPISAYREDDGGEGTQLKHLYQQTEIDGVPCYRKFRAPDAIHLVVAGGTAGKFSAVIGSWATGPRGSQVVTYAIR